ncbi:efflux RND transporter periplasmic adaptor subunit [Streptomyces sp. FIT100]|uniref:efflux RND transporter periplasmic adaptor subunit n=1 Tax=Streptomyces sp. FIT100 TaxID=2837956 RepID=UPI0021CAB6AA|nr:peptidoglycan-binding protein [Streptomyces sp. FIT100]UUN28256.1 peptidoglycan-binding protein [Streptomyces sp. FIT100]
MTSAPTVDGHPADGHSTEGDSAEGHTAESDSAEGSSAEEHTAESSSTEGSAAESLTSDGRSAKSDAASARFRPRRRKGRGRKIAVALLVLAAAGAATAATLGIGIDLDGRDGGTDPAAALPPSTAEVTRRTLKDTQSADGELGYGPATGLGSRLPGTLTQLPASGDTISRGKPLFKVDDKPVTLMYGPVPAYRAMKAGITEGPDVEQLERNLAALGHTGFTVDEEFTDATADAVKAWQEDQGLPETGAVEFGRVVFAPAAVRVDSLAAAEGDAAGPGGKVLSYTGTDQVVTAELDVADQRLAKKGAEVAIAFPDGTSAKGTIAEVSTVIEPGEGGQDTEPETRIETIVELGAGKNQKAAAAFALASVDVTFTAEEHKDVLTVPVAALVALQEGGYGVEAVEGTTTRYVPVDTGLFADGRVEISGDGIAEGMTVGMPR